MVTAHVPVPEQLPPLQPAKVEPPAGAAVSVTTVPLLYEAEHVAPQLIPAGLEVTVPLPDPVLLTESVNVWTLNVAVTAAAALTETPHSPVPSHLPPLHPPKLEQPASAPATATT